MKTLTLARQGKAMMVVTSYGPAGDVILDLDNKSLALPDDAIAVERRDGCRTPAAWTGTIQAGTASARFPIDPRGAAGPKKVNMSLRGFRSTSRRSAR